MERYKRLEKEIKNLKEFEKKINIALAVVLSVIIMLIIAYLFTGHTLEAMVGLVLVTIMCFGWIMIIRLIFENVVSYEKEQFDILFEITKDWA